MKIRNSWDDGFEEVAIEVNQYTTNNNLAIQLYCVTGLYATLTTNLGEKLPENQAYVDTNNLPTAEEFIQDNKLGKPIGIGHSGFCTYPLYEFNMEALRG